MKQHASFSISAKCIIPLVVTLYAPTKAHAASYALVGYNSNTGITSVLTSAGHTVADNPASSGYGSYDGIILLRAAGNSDLASYVFDGGLLITEWSGTEWALNTIGMLGTTSDIGGGYVATGTPVTFTSEGVAAGLSNGLTNTYADADRTDYFRDFGTIDPTAAIVYGTRSGGAAAIIGGSYGSGSVLLIGYDWADSISVGSPSAQLLSNAVEFSAISAVPEPGSVLALGLLVGSGVFLRCRRGNAS